MAARTMTASPPSCQEGGVRRYLPPSAPMNPGEDELLLAAGHRHAAVGRLAVHMDRGVATSLAAVSDRAVDDLLEVDPGEAREGREADRAQPRVGVAERRRELPEARSPVEGELDGLSGEVRIGDEKLAVLVTVDDDGVAPASAGTGPPLEEHDLRPPGRLHGGEDRD